MQVQDISLTQIVVVLLFLGVLIALQQLLKNNKFSFQSHLNKKKRIKFVDEFAFSNSERIRLIRVDDKEYLYFLVKGSAPTIIPHEGKSTLTNKRNIELSKLSDKRSDELRSEEKSASKNNILSDAISNARRMNPKLGFKK
jgi:flagellar biogenesis protein FliO